MFAAPVENRSSRGGRSALIAGVSLNRPGWHVQNNGRFHETSDGLTHIPLTHYNLIVSSFVHLHLHTQYSLLDGMNTVEPLIETAKRFGMPAIAMTDHGNLFGAIEFYQAAKKAGIKPIIGCEVYMAPKSRLSKEGAGVHEDDYSEGGGGSNPYYHLILLASNEIGYKNLMKLISIANIEGFYYKPRIDKEVLQKHSAGLIGLSGCLRGEVPYLLNLGYEKEAQDAAGVYQDIFGKDRFFIEVQDNGLDLQKTVNQKLIPLAQKNGIPLVATNDCHYLHREDTRAHDIMLCLQTGKTVNAPNRMRFQTDQLYFKSPEEMAAAFSELPDAVHNTLRIADLVDLNLKFGELHLPHYQPPDGMTRENYLKSLAEAGLARRFIRPDGNNKQTGGVGRIEDEAQIKTYGDRLSKELSVINTVGYAGYFLIVWDIISHAKNTGIPVGPGRGSAAGSLVAYALGITDIDPIAYGLLFERFLNPERVSPPDIDIDISMDHREDVLEYVSKKFGTDHVCQIITFGTMAAKAAIRDVGRALEIPYGEVDKIAKLVPNTLNITLGEALAQEARLRQATEESPQRAELMVLAKKLEGLARHASTHAAGVVISAEPLTEYVPLYRSPHGEIVTQYAMSDVEKIGLVKFDFLGLRTLTVIDHACRLIHEKEPEFHLSSLPMDDAKTYAFLGSGETMGIFQLESSGMRDLLVKMKPSQFEDIIALLALYRPGPLASGMVDDFIKRRKRKTKIQYELPQLEPILKETYGVILYQEQVMKIANVLACFSLGEADLLRRAMGKKKAEEMAAQKNLFIKRAIDNQIPEKKAEKIFDLMEYFAGYGFNKSHSAAYALITYQTAYLKCHFPNEFMAALLTSEKGNSDKVVRYITECRRMGILILPPDANESEKDFAVVPRGIRFGLAAIKNVGTAAVDAMMAARSEYGPFKSLLDFCQKVDSRKVNKRVLEGLLKAGAFDFTKERRLALLDHLEQTMHAGEKSRKSGGVNQTFLFGAEEESPQTGSPAAGSGTPSTGEDSSDDADVAEIARMEKEVLGFYITSHPLARYEAQMKEHNAIPMEALENLEESENAVRICGVIGEERVVRTKKGDPMAYLRLEDLTGSVEVIVFPDLYRTATSLIKQEQPVFITGTVDRSEHGIKFKATTLALLKKGPSLSAEQTSSSTENIPPSLTIILSSEKALTAMVKELKEMLQSASGASPVYLQITTPEQCVVIDIKMKVSISRALISQMEAFLGEGSVSIKQKSEEAV